MKEYKYTLRAHHGMCLAFFRGKGYSREFVENMTKIKEALGENPLIKIVNETEDICAECPDNHNGKCISFQKVLEFDNKVLSFCQLQPGTIMHFSDFEKLVKERILDAGIRENICGNCQWTAICH